MISLYSGTPGSGKSFHLAQEIIRLNSLKIPIISNLLVNSKYLKYPNLYFYKSIEEIDPGYLISFYLQYKDIFKLKKENDIVLILDECQVIFNTRDYNKPDRRAWLTFFQLHRHYLYKIILCCQWDYMLDKQIRALIEFEYKHRKLKNFGYGGFIADRLISLFTLSNCVFGCIKMYYGLHEKLEVTFILCRGKAKKLYNTHQLLNSDLPPILRKYMEDKGYFDIMEEK